MDNAKKQRKKRKLPHFLSLVSLKEGELGERRRMRGQNVNRWGRFETVSERSNNESKSTVQILAKMFQLIIINKIKLYPKFNFYHRTI